jgi:nucleotide-binding universal stress UspA family protein
MKILVAVDENAYSRYAVRQAARLAANTWADVVMLAIEKNRSYIAEEELDPSHAHPRLRLLNRYRADFLDALGPGVDLYDGREDGPLTRREDKVLEQDLSGRKTFRLHLRGGNPVKAITAEARAEGCDLVILGCGQHEGGWGRGSDVPGRVADAADCSVFVIREEPVTSRVVCCLDHGDISQESLELINQWVTIYAAGLEVVGVLKKGELREEVEAKMGEVLDYYLKRDVNALIRVVDEDSLETFIESGRKDDLMALWLRHKSPLQRFFHSKRVNALVNHASSSMLILR